MHMVLSIHSGMQRFLIVVLLIKLGFAANLKDILSDPEIASARRAQYLALTDSWARDVEFTPAEKAAMQAGRKWEPLMMKGPGDPLAKRILAAGEPSYDAVASLYPGKILDRTILGTFSDPRQPISEYSDEFAIYWNGAIACNLIKGRFKDHNGGTTIQPVAHNTIVVFKVGREEEPFGRVRSRYSSIGYENGYLPVVTAAYELDGVRYAEYAFADKPVAETDGWLRAVQHDQYFEWRPYGRPSSRDHLERRRKHDAKRHSGNGWQRRRPDIAQRFAYGVPSQESRDR